MSRAKSTSRSEGRHLGSSELPPESKSGTAAPELDALREIMLHGHHVVYRSAGSGPVVVLVHG
jgi:hypothetical protein